MGASRLNGVIDAQRPNLALWTPVLFGGGIGLYFAAPREPAGWMLAALLSMLAMCALTLPRVGPAARLVVLALILPGLGFTLAAWRSHWVAAPVLPYPATLNVEGRIVALDRSESGRPRVTLDRLVLYGVEPWRTPQRIRISLESDTPQEMLTPGMRVAGRARLSPPSAPAEPGGFDFRRLAWFSQLGAVGYARTPMVEVEPVGRAGWRQRVFETRIALARAIQAAVPGRNGGFAAAILTGDRSEVDPAALEALRASNLAHLLAISGLHMGLLSGFVFALVRYGGAFVPALALAFPIKKVAAVAALMAGVAYLLLSGASVATQRAFIMTSVVLVAVLIDRPAFTLRSVALAAMIVLVLRPEALMEAGFQMSFAATTALIAAFEWLRSRDWWRETQGEEWRFLRPVIGVTVTSFVAGVATAPFSAFHFNTVAQYGLAANILAVPAMGLVVMPAAVLAGLFAPLGLAAPALWVMDAGIGYILAIAEFIASRDGAVRAVPSGPPASLGLVAIGGLVVVLWIGRGRLLGVALIGLGAAAWTIAERPDLLISENGRLFGVKTEAGRALNSNQGNGFVAQTWLENDGDRATQEIASRRLPVDRKRGFARMDWPGEGAIVYRGSRDQGLNAARDCADAAILVAPLWREAPEGGCVFIGEDFLRREGALAIWRDTNGLRIDGARTLNEARPWTRDPAR